MKRFEVAYDGKRVTLTRESEEHLTGEQKYTIILTALICPTICFVVSTFLGLFR